MANQQDPSGGLDSTLQELLSQAATAAPSVWEQFVKLQNARADALNRAATELKTQLGDKDSRVVTLTRTAALADQRKQLFRTEAARVANVPRVNANQWAAFGRVLDLQGKPVPGVRVRVFDRDRKYDDLLGDTMTDEFGNFSVTYDTHDFAEPGEANPDLYVMVSDAEDKLLYSSRGQVRMEAGRAEYFEIVLGSEPPPPGAVKEAPVDAAKEAPPKRKAAGRPRKQKPDDTV